MNALHSHQHEPHTAISTLTTSPMLPFPTWKCTSPSPYLLTVRTGTSSGMPAKKLAMRASLARWLLGPSTLPTTMSPMSAGLMRVRSSTALNTVDRRSTASVSFSPPRLACANKHSFQ